MMESLLGASVTVFVGVTLFLFGGASWLMGQAVAETWRPVWQIFVYGAMLAAGNRFFIYALFDSWLLSLPAYLFNTAVLIALGLLAFRLTTVRRMVSQYPWLYERAGAFAWREPRWEQPGPADPGREPLAPGGGSPGRERQADVWGKG